MAYDDLLASRIRAQLSTLPNLVEKKMFGGIGFILQGNMACGVNKNNLIVRVGIGQYETALSRPHVRPFDMTGKPMTGWVVVEPQGYTNDAELKRWIKQGVEYAASLPPK
jgi:TfoX/Sxy family transcriptional regulator of competence genes